MLKDKSYYAECGPILLYSEHSVSKLKDTCPTSKVMADDGTIFTANRLCFPERIGKIRNLFRLNSSGEVLWSAAPLVPELAGIDYDYFTWVRVHDEPRNLVEAFTASGYKLIIDASTGSILGCVKDHVFRFLEIREGVVIKEDQTPLDLHGKVPWGAIEVDDGIIVLIRQGSFPEFEESKRLFHEIYAAEQSGLPVPPKKPDFPGAIATLWKVKPDGEVIQTAAPPRLGYPCINAFESLHPGKETTQIEVMLNGPVRPDEWYVLDVRDFSLLSKFENY